MLMTEQCGIAKASIVRNSELTRRCVSRARPFPVYKRVGDPRGRATTLQTIADAPRRPGAPEQDLLDIYETLAQAFAIAKQPQVPDGIALVGRGVV
jgi:hypothetical protein